MIRQLVLSVQSKYAKYILNGDKIFELRKIILKDFDEIVKKYGGIWVNIYVTEALPYLIRWTDKIANHSNYAIYSKLGNHPTLNGKVVARFWLDEYEKYYFNEYQGDYRLINKSKEILRNATMNYDKLCLTEEQVNNYGKGKDLYAWHIKNLEIFDEPKELSEFYIYDDSYDNAFGWLFEDREKYIELKKAPQMYRFVYVKENENGKTIG